MRVTLLSTFLIFGLAASSAVAQALSVTGGARLGFTNEASSGVTSNAYGYVKGSIANFYLGASADIYNDSALNEVDLYAGYTNSLANGLSYDVSYTRYIYPNGGGDCCGGVGLSLSLPLGAAVTGTADANYYPEDHTTDTHLTLDYVLNDKTTLTGRVGRVGNVGAADTKEWELAASYALGQQTAVKVHYYDGSDYKGYFGLDLTWDTALLGG